MLSQEADEDRQRVLVNYRNTYFTRDLMQLSNTENLEGLLAVFQYLTRSIGSHLEVSNLARESGLSFPTAKKYLNALNQAQLTFKLYGYQYGPAKRYVKAAKTYFCDNGLIHSLNPRVDQGRQLENFVLAELEKRRKIGHLPAEQLFYYKSRTGHEIDLVFETGDTLNAVEIKAARSPGPRDLQNLKRFVRSLNRPVKAYLVYMGEHYETVEGVRLVPVGALFRGT